MLFQTNLGSLAGGFPLNGSFVNPNDGTLYQLQSYTTNNVLDMCPDTGLTNGTLFLTTPKVYDTIAILANSANASSANSGTLTLHFNDGTTYVTNYYAPDWFNNNSGSLYTVALQGFQRININSGSAISVTRVDASSAVWASSNSIPPSPATSIPLAPASIKPFSIVAQLSPTSGAKAAMYTSADTFEVTPACVMTMPPY